MDQNQMLADQLRRYQAQQGGAPQGRMVGNTFVAPHALEYLAAGLRNVGGMRGEQLTRQAMQDEQTKQEAMQKQDMGTFLQMLRGRDANAVQMDDEGNKMPEAQIPGDPAAAYSFAMGSKSPMVQKIGMTGVSQMVKTPKWEKVELPTATGEKRVGFVDMNAQNPMATFQEGGKAPVKYEFIEGQAVNPYTTEKYGAPIAKQLAPDAVVMRDASGNLVPNTPVINAKSQVARAGASNVSVNTAQKPFLTEIGKGAGENVVRAFEGAQSAVQALQNAQQLEQGLSKAIVGPTANARLTIAQVGDMLGIGGASNAERLQNTKAVMQGLARQELAAAAQMRGQGQITQPEREILRRAEAGQINDMSKPEIQYLISAIKKTAQYRISAHNQNLERLSKDPSAQDITRYMQVTAPNLDNDPTEQGGMPSLSAIEAEIARRKGGK